MNCDNYLQSEAYKNTLNKLNAIDKDFTSTNISSLIYDVCSDIKGEEDVLPIRLAFNSVENSTRFNLRLCTHCSISSIPYLRSLGFSHTLEYLSSSKDGYRGVNLKEFTFNNMFDTDDQGAIKRSLVPYVYNILAENMSYSDKFEDLKIYIYNKLLKAANFLKQVVTFIPSGMTPPELVSIMLDLACNDAICREDSDYDFYDRLVYKWVDDRNYKYIYETRDLIVNQLNRIGNHIVKEFETTWLECPERIIIYMNIKNMLFRSNPNYYNWELI